MLQSCLCVYLSTAKYSSQNSLTSALLAFPALLFAFQSLTSKILNYSCLPKRCITAQNRLKKKNANERQLYKVLLLHAENKMLGNTEVSETDLGFENNFEDIFSCFPQAVRTRALIPLVLPWCQTWLIKKSSLTVFDIGCTTGAHVTPRGTHMAIN